MGTPNFDEIENGRITKISNYWENSDTLLGTAEMNPGYYYLGASAKTNSTLYNIQILYSNSLEI